MTVKEQAQYIYSGQRVKIRQDYQIKHICYAGDLVKSPYANEEVRWMCVAPSNDAITIEIVPSKERKEKVFSVSDFGKILYSEAYVKVVSCCEPLFYGRAKELETCEYKDHVVLQAYIGAIDKETLHLEITEITAP